MAYNKKEIFDKCIKVAKEKKCFFIEQLISYLPISKYTFYNYFKKDSNEYNEIKNIIDDNKEITKSAMYRKWFESDNATLQLALMKLLGTDNQAHRLNGTNQKIEHSGEINIKPKEWV